ncbi:MAG: hypothetical protein KC912_07055 [Proteobacteria bacterium]|nr:hypothetical protein [Pseudomonadota bacterium]
MIRAIALLTLIACTGPEPTDDPPETGETGETGDTAVESLACTNFSEPGLGEANELPTLLSETGCVEADNWTTVDTLLPYDINAPFWSDNAVKTRFIAVPTGGTIGVYDDGDFEFPKGTTLMKHFTLNGRKIETRLFILHSTGIWGGYSYEWNDAQTDATLLDAAKERDVDGQAWTYPSRADCRFCHAAAAGGSLGPEIGQINKDYTYADGTMNQIEKWAAMGWFTEDPGTPTSLDVYPNPTDTSSGTVEERARSYLHTNCSQCHRPGGASHLPMDWRISAPLDSATCDAVPNNPGTITDARILAPGEPDRSVMYVRTGNLDWRMPPVGSNVIDTQGLALVGEWITSINDCPTAN